MKILVTGGAGFIGSAVVRKILKETEDWVINVDKLTYAGNLESLSEVKNKSLYSFKLADICDKEKMQRIFFEHKPDIVMHLAAESHVDRSIDGPDQFIQTNIFGTYNLLQVAKNYYYSLDDDKKKKFRFHHISTDEVFGSLGKSEYFVETTPYDPSSPYSASKASSDHLVRAWGRTFGLPVLITNCSNNYGPYQFPEKLIPLMILNALENKPLPVYGDGKNIRDWLYVDDHADALLWVAKQGKIGETYNIGGNCEKTNLEVVMSICDILDEIKPKESHFAPSSYKDLIQFVTDRPGHDMRYAIDASKIRNQLGFRPKETFSSGLEKTILWYLNNPSWVESAQAKYQRERLGKS